MREERGERRETNGARRKESGERREDICESGTHLVVVVGVGSEHAPALDPVEVGPVLRNRHPEPRDPPPRFRATLW